MAIFSVFDFVATTKVMLNELVETRNQHAIESAGDLTALTKIRILERGEDYEGNPFSNYSTPYAKFRRDTGRQDKWKDYNYSGALHASVYPEVTEETQNSVTVEIRPHGSLSELKAQSGSNREGEFIFRPSEEEIDIFNDIYLERRLAVINKHLG